MNLQGGFYTGDIPVCQHMTNVDSAQFSVLIKGHAPYYYQVLDWQGHSLSVEMWDHEKYKDSIWGIDKLIVRGLKSGGHYRLRVIDRVTGSLLDERLFKNLPLNQKKQLRFAMVSCSDDRFLFQNKHMWNLLFDEQPEMIFLIGDNCYVDCGSEGSDSYIWKRYAETRMALNHFRQSFLIPTLAIWDDHDYGHDNANKHFKNKVMALRTFKLFYGSQDVEGYKNTLGTGSILTGFGQRFCFLDDRYFRDVPEQGGYMWGREQQELVLEILGQNDKPTWLLNGSQYYGPYPSEESFLKDYYKNLVDLNRQLSKISAPIVFGSGDVHFSEVMQIDSKILGYRTFEFTSSSIHSANPPYSLFLKNPRRVATCWQHNFMIITSEALPQGLQISAYAIGRFGRPLLACQGTVHR